MAQAPATPKLRRARIQAAASLGLPPGPVQPSEAAAIAARSRAIQPPKDPYFQCLIPLVGRHHVRDWAAVEARLAATLDSFFRQTCPNWKLLICGQDRPALPADPRVAWLPFTTPVEGNDKWAKLHALTETVSAQMTSPCYVMTFDADDLLAPWVVDHMVRTGSPSGYLITRGFVLDASTGGLAEARPQTFKNPGQKAFWKLCGSCAALRCDTPSDVRLLQAITQHEHRMFPYLARLAKRPLTPVPNPAALYIVNHGENFGIRRGRRTFKTRFVTRFPANARLRAQAQRDYPGLALAPQV